MQWRPVGVNMNRVLCLIVMLGRICVALDYFTSMNNMKQLSDCEQNMIQKLEEHAQERVSSLHQLKRLVQQMRESIPSQTKINSSAVHPTDIYATTKRWHKLKQLFPEDMKVSKLHELCVRDKIPLSELEGASAGIIRLMRTYNLRPDDIISGDVMGYKSQQKLSAEDMVSLARAALETSEEAYAVQFLKHAIMTAEAEDAVKFQHEAGVLLATVYTRKRHYSRAKKVVTDVLHGCVDRLMDCHRKEKRGDCNSGVQTKTVTCPRACGHCKLHYNGREYQELVAKMPMVVTADESISTMKEPELMKPNPSWLKTYEQLCRGEVEPNHYGYCHFRQSRVPIIVFKEEVLSRDPRIAMIYDVITENEAAAVIQQSNHTLQRAKVGTNRADSKARVSAITWLSDSTPLAEKLSRRVELITGLVTTKSRARLVTSSDAFQVVNYGLGGHYEPHLDYFKKEDLHNVSSHNDIKTLIRLSGDRIATFLYYLTDVQWGGGTVFPNIGVAVKAVKNAAAFWFNCGLSGEYDPRTQHAGCPVLLGEKWVMNKWVREYGNEFTRRCGLQKDSVSDTGL